MATSHSSDNNKKHTGLLAKAKSLAANVTHRHGRKHSTQYRSTDDNYSGVDDPLQPLLPSQNTEEQPSEKITKWLILSVCIACMAGFAFGYDTGGISGVLIAPSFSEYFKIDSKHKAQVDGTIVALLQLGCLAGALGGNLFADRLGRRKTIFVAGLVLAAGITLQVLGITLVIFYIGRFISGFGIGMLSMIVPVYIAEISPKNIRGQLGSLWQLFITIGIAISYWMNYGIKGVISDDDNFLWRSPIGFQLLPTLVLILGILPMSESPRWLCSKDKDNEAKASLAKLRGLDEEDPHVLKELDDIRSVIHESNTLEIPTYREIFSNPKFRRPLLLGCSLQAFQQLSGTNVINYFTPTIFQSLGFSSAETDLFATGLYGIVKLVATLVGAFWLADRLGRKKLLEWGGGAMAIGMFATAIAVKIHDPNHIGAVGYAGIISIYIFGIAYSISWGLLIWVICSEIFSNRLRAKCASLTSAVNWGFNAMMGKLGPLFLAHLAYGTYIIFGAMAVIMAAFVWEFVPETKGKSLEEIEKIFSKPVSEQSEEA